MIDNRVIKRFAPLVCAAALFVGNDTQGGSITGDEFTATLSEGGAPLGTADGIAGSPDDDAVVVDDATFFALVNWTDGDTFELDFFSGLERSLVNLTWSLTGLDFMDAGSPVDIIGLTEADAEFGWSYSADFDAHSITIVYPSLNVGAAADGEIISFDVLTAPPVPEPGGMSLLLTAIIGLLSVRRSADPR